MCRRVEVKPSPADVKLDDATSAKLEEQGVKIKGYQEKVLELEAKISRIPTEQPPVSSVCLKLDSSVPFR